MNWAQRAASAKKKQASKIGIRRQKKAVTVEDEKPSKIEKTKCNSCKRWKEEGEKDKDGEWYILRFR